MNHSLNVGVVAVPANEVTVADGVGIFGLGVSCCGCYCVLAFFNLLFIENGAVSVVEEYLISICPACGKSGSTLDIGILCIFINESSTCIPAVKHLIFSCNGVCKSEAGVRKLRIDKLVKGYGESVLRCSIEIYGVHVVECDGVLSFLSGVGGVNVERGLNVCKVLAPAREGVIPFIVRSLFGICGCCCRRALFDKVCFYNGVSVCALLFSIEIYVIVGSGRTAWSGVRVSFKIGYVGIGDNVLKYRLGLVVLEVNCSVNVLYNNSLTCGNVFKSNLVTASDEYSSRYFNVCKLNRATSNAVAKNEVTVYGAVLEGDVRNVYHE